MGTIKRFLVWAKKLNWAFVGKDSCNANSTKYTFISPQGLVVELFVNDNGNIDYANNISVDESDV